VDYTEFSNVHVLYSFIGIYVFHAREESHSSRSTKWQRWEIEEPMNTFANHCGYQYTIMTPSVTHTFFLLILSYVTILSSNVGH